jgi:hypothetical protein
MRCVQLTIDQDNDKRSVLRKVDQDFKRRGREGRLDTSSFNPTPLHKMSSAMFLALRL